MLNRYIALDLETTGFSATSSDIIEIGAWKIEDGVAKEKFCTYVRPYSYIPRNIQQLTGITPEMVKDSPVLEEILFEFFDWCSDYPFVGHNIQFDYSFLVTKGKNIGLDFTLSKSRMGIDTLKLSKKYLNLQSNKLKDVLDYFNIEYDEDSLHSAKVDSYMCKLLIDRFNTIVKGADLIPSPLDEDGRKYGTVTNEETLSFE